MRKNLLLHPTARAFLTLLSLLLLWSISSKAQTKQAYAVESEDETILTFYYDDQRESRTGKKIHDIPTLEKPYPTWEKQSYHNKFKRVVFDPSFADFRPKIARSYFSGFGKLESIEGLQYFNTSEVVNMSRMFSKCGLTSLDLSHFDTSKVTNMEQMFFDCSNLTSLDLSSFNTSQVTNMMGMFWRAGNLTSLDLSSFNTSQVTNMDMMFYECKSLTSLDLSNFNTSQVTDMNRMFDHCSSLTSLDLSHFNTSQVTNMNAMFAGCKSLPSLDVSSFNTSQVTKMNAMFAGCKSLPSLDVSSFNTSQVTDMNRMFDHCSSLTSLDLSHFNTSQVTDMGCMFYVCSSLTSLDLSHFNTSQVTDMGYMFYVCSSLTSLDVSGFNTSRVKRMDFMFNDCSNLKTIYCANSWSCAQSSDMFGGCTYLFGAVTYDERKTDATMANPTTGYFTMPGVVKKEAYAVASADGTTLTFYYDTQRASRTGSVYDMTSMLGFNTDVQNRTFTQVTFDASFAEYPLTSTKQWFYGYSNLSRIEGLEHLNTSQVTDMGEMFYFCSSLTSLDLANFNTSQVTNMSGMFSGCSSLTSLDLSSFNTSQVTNMSGMFNFCSSLTSLDLSSFNTSQLTDMSLMFFACRSLTSLDVSGFNTSQVTDMKWMFNGCSKLETIYCANSWSCDKSEKMFYACRKLVGAVPYDESQVDVTMANPTTGYFTMPGVVKKEAYAVVSADGTTLTFYYDDQRASRTGSVYDIPGKFEPNGWSTHKETVTQVAFDASFAEYKPTGTGGWFHSFSKLSRIEGLEHLNTSEVISMGRMFYKCSSLTSLDLSHFDTSQVIDMGGMFTGCRSLTSLDLSSFNTSQVTDMGEMFYECSSLTSLDVSHFDTSRVTYMVNMFAECSSLTSLDVTNFNTSQVTNMNGLFAACRSLTSLEVSHFDTSKVTNMKGLFYECSSLTSLDLSHFNTSQVTDMALMFNKCGALTSLDLSHFDTSQVIDMYCMFYGCIKLTSLDLSSFNTSQVTNMRGMFYHCSSLTSLDLSHFNTSQVRDMSYMFTGCSSLMSLNLSQFKSNMLLDASAMFGNCSQLKTIYCANTWSCDKSEKMFYNCGKLVGAVPYDASKDDVTMANPTTGYFKKSAKFYSVTVSPTTGGSIRITDKNGAVVSDLTRVQEGTELQVEAVADSGFAFVALEVTTGGNTIRHTDSRITVTVTGNMTIGASFQREVRYYSVTVSPTTGGSIRITDKNGAVVSDLTRIQEGTELQVEAVADSGFAFVALEVTTGGNTTRHTDSRITVTVTGNMTIGASFQREVRYYSVTVSPTTGGSIRITDKNGAVVSDLTRVQEGTELQVEAVADSGFAFVALEVTTGGNTTRHTDSRITVTVTGNMTIGASFQQGGSLEEILARGVTIVEIYTPEGIRISELQEGVNIVKLSDGSYRKYYFTR